MASALLHVSVDRSVAFTLALRGGEALLGAPETEDGGPAGGLLDGAAAVGLAALDLHKAAGDERYRRLAATIADRLAGPDASESTVLFHLARARTLGDQPALRAACALGDRIAAAPGAPAGPDQSAAGTGLVLLSLYHATRRRGYLEAARGIARALALPDDERAAAVPLPAVADAALLLVELAATLRDHDPGTADAVCPLYEPMFAALAGRAERSAAHGPAAARASLGLYRLTRSRDALRAACDAGRSLWDAASLLPLDAGLGPAERDALVAAIDVFLDLASHGAGAEWRQHAESLLPGLAALAALAGPGSGPTTFGAAGPGDSSGTAAVVRALLRLAGHAVSPTTQVTRRQIRHFAREPEPRTPAAPRRPSAERRGGWRRMG